MRSSKWGVLATLTARMGELVQQQARLDAMVKGTREFLAKAAALERDIDKLRARIAAHCDRVTAEVLRAEVEAKRRRKDRL